VEGYAIELDGRTWPTTEHYFQAQKFKDHPFKNTCEKSPKPRDIFSIARSESATTKKTDSRNWERIKDVMYRAVKAKFLQHPFLNNFLLQIGDAYLVEHILPMIITRGKVTGNYNKIIDAIDNRFFDRV